MSVSTTLAVTAVGTTASTLTTASSTVLNPATYGIRNFLMLANADATIGIWVNFGGTAAANSAGSFLIAAGNNIKFDTFVPSNAVNAAAVSGTPILTVIYA